MTTLSAPTDEQRLLHAAWMTKALERMPYMASLLYSLRVLHAPGTGTFAVDAHHRLYVDFDAVTPWGVDECGQALLHEAMHLVYAHSVEAENMRIEPRERPTWNLATDSAINDDLRDAGCDYIARVGVLPEAIGCSDYQTASDYMTELRKRQPPASSGGGGNTEGEDGQDQSQPGAQAGSGQEDYQGCGSGSGADAAPWELPADDDLNGQAPAATSGEKEVIKVRVAQDTQQAEKTRGDVPAGMTQWAEQSLAKPKIPWQKVLSSMVRRSVAIRGGDFDTTYARRNRRRPHTEMFGGRVVNPGLYAPVPSVALVRDTSGSMSADDLNRVGAEVEGIARQIGIRGRELMVIDVDAQAYDPRPYMRLESLREVEGRGGTDMRVGIDAAARLKPSVIIVCTDGYTSWNTFATTRIPVVACLIGSEHGDGAVPQHVIESVPKWMHSVVVEAEQSG